LWQAAARSAESRGWASRDANARLQIGYDNHVGHMKTLLTQTNQDCLAVATMGPLSLVAVCDGISTANAGTGDVASSIASHVIANLWEQDSAAPRDSGSCGDPRLPRPRPAHREHRRVRSGSPVRRRQPRRAGADGYDLHGGRVER
jgi:hypothetical protein